MKRFDRDLVRSVFRCAAFVTCLLLAWSAFVDAQNSRDVTETTVSRWMAELSNWGRWGDNDQLGTINLITAEKRRLALTLPAQGVSVSLSHNYLTEEAADATSPIGREMLARIDQVLFEAIATHLLITDMPTHTWIRCVT